MKKYFIVLVILLLIFNCSNNLNSITVNNTKNIGKIKELNSNLLILYPNPVNDIIFVKSSFIGNIFVTDSNGSVFKDTILTNLDPNKMNVESLNKGMYYIVIEKNDTIKSAKAFYKI